MLCWNMYVTPPTGYSRISWCYTPRPGDGSGGDKPHCRWLAVGGMYGIISSISGSPDDDDEKARVSLKI